MRFNKQSNFEPNLRVRVICDGQTGIYVGGMSRQFFTDLFLAASTGANGIPGLLFLLGEFLVERKYHVIKVNHEIKYPEKVAVYTCNN